MRPPQLNVNLTRSQKAAYSANIHMPHFPYIHNIVYLSTAAAVVCCMTHSEQTHNQHTYNGKCIHYVSHCMAAHTREYVLSTPAKPRKNVSNLLQTESVPVE